LEECFRTTDAINEAELDEREAMSIAGKVVVKTNKKNVPSALTIRNGEIIELEPTSSLMPYRSRRRRCPNFQTAWTHGFLNMQRDQSASPHDR